MKINSHILTPVPTENISGATQQQNSVTAKQLKKNTKSLKSTSALRQQLNLKR